MAVPQAVGDKLLENGLDGIVPYSVWIVDVLFGQSKANVCRMILPFLGLRWVPNPEPEPPGHTDDGIGEQVRRSERVTGQLGRLDLRVDGREIARLSSDGTAVLLLHGVPSTKNDGFGALELAHGHLCSSSRIQHVARGTGSSTNELTENKEQEDAQRPLPTMATFLGSNNASAGGSMAKG